jgi:hypothetical protein
LGATLLLLLPLPAATVLHLQFHLPVVGYPPLRGQTEQCYDLPYSSVSISTYSNLAPGGVDSDHVISVVCSHSDWTSSSVPSPQLSTSFVCPELALPSQLTYKLIKPEPVEPEDTLVRHIRSRGDVAMFTKNIDLYIECRVQPRVVR